MSRTPKVNHFHDPLNPKDTEAMTVGCRNTNKLVCGKYGIPKICAFVRPDGMCMKPPLSWSKQYKLLKGKK